MDPEKILKFLTENIAEFFKVSVDTLVRPVAKFQLVPVASMAESPLIPNAGSDSGAKPWLHPRLFAFATVSVIFGNMLNNLIPNRRTGPDLFVTVVITLIYWFVYSSGLHLFCRVLRGRGQYVDTLAVSIQVLATLFVVASVLTLGLSLLTQLPVMARLIIRIPLIGDILYEEPAFFFFGIQALLLAVYLPLALKHVHGFGWIRQLLIGILPFITMWFGVIPFVMLGLMGFHG